MKRQFAIKLSEHDGEKGNFLAYGAFERIIAGGWRLKDRILAHSATEIFVFETELDVPSFQNRWPYDPILEEQKPRIPDLRTSLRGGMKAK